MCSDLIEHGNYLFPSQTAICFNRETFSRKHIEYCHGLEAAAISPLIRDKVETPGVIGLLLTHTASRLVTTALRRRSERE